MKHFVAALLLLLTLIALSNAQTTAFSYQGSLNNSGTPANGDHDFEFALFDSLGGVNQIGTTQTRSNVVVTNGAFSVTLDFGSQFPGSNRFLEVRVRTAGGGAFIPLTPRQQVNSAPYSIKSVAAESAVSALNATNATNASQLGGVNANQYVLTTDSRMTDPRPPSAGSGSYIQNQNAGPQATSNFNISGNGTAGGTFSANIVNAATQYNLGGTRIIGITGFLSTFSSTFVGLGAGLNGAGSADNSFFGTNAGRNTNDEGFTNSFFGVSAGFANQTGDGNAFFGFDAGEANTTGNANSFFGNNAGATNVSGIQNTAIGALADVGSGGLSRSTAVGFRALVTQSDSMVLGAINGVNGSTNDTRVGIGITAPTERLHVVGNAIVTGNFTANGTFGANIVNAATQYNIGGNRVFKVDGPLSNTFVGVETGEATAGTSNSFFGSRAGKANVNGAGNSFFGASAGTANTNAIGNSFFGLASGAQTTTGGSNAFFGWDTGTFNTIGNRNSFFGTSTGRTNVTGTHLSLFGFSADSSDGLTNATAIGSRALVTESNALVLGSINGLNTATADTNVGIGTTAPSARFHVVGASGASSTPVAIVESVGSQIPLSFRSGATEYARVRANNLGNLTLATVGGTDRNILFRAGDDSNTDMFIDGGTANVGIGTLSPADKLDVNGSIRVAVLGVAGPTALCRNASNQISTCSSSGRYKSHIATFSAGLDLIRKLRPVSFYWREGGMLDLGLVAEDVAKVEPLLTTTNDKGEIEGVKYDRVGVVLVNAVKEQQTEIDSLRKTNAEQDARLRKQEAEIDALKKLVCATNSRTALCRKQPK